MLVFSMLGALDRIIGNKFGLGKEFERGFMLLGNMALSMMTMKLWLLVDLALPMLVILVGQMILMAFFGVFVTFRFMGKNFDAAVMTVGQTGFGLGAVPTAMANMQVIDSKYGPSPSAFFIVPLVGSLFINLVNSAIITVFLNIV